MVEMEHLSLFFFPKFKLFIFLEKYDIVGTTIYDTKNLPKDIIADEHHIKVKGEKK